MTTLATPPQGSMPISARKAEVSFAYMKMVANTAGLSVGSWDVDYDGVDLTLRTDAEYSSGIGSRIDVQLKCTSQLNLQHDETISYSLSRRKYEKLKHPRRYEVAMLAVLVVPESHDEWLLLDESGLLANCVMYYSLTDEWDYIDDDAQSKTVTLKKVDRVNVQTILEVMQRAAEGGGIW